MIKHQHLKIKKFVTHAILLMVLYETCHIFICYLHRSGGPPAWGGGLRGQRLPAETPLLAATGRKRLGLQGLKGHCARGVAGN